MLWLYRLQQRLQITRRESLAIASLLGLFLTGVVVQEVQERRTPPLAADAFLAPQPASPALPAAADSRATPSDSLAADRATEEGSDVSRIDVNRATALQLQALPGIGPALAGRIIDHRSRRPFARTEDLLDVSGIGPKTLVRIAPLVRTGPALPDLDTPPAESPVAATDTVLGPSRSPR
jgi:competence ComEA-like helix-hairpin-helix protein